MKTEFTEDNQPTSSLAMRLNDGPCMMATAVSTGHLTVEKVRKGLPVEEFDRLLALLKCSSEDLSLWLGLSKATLHRRRQAGRLTKEESDRIMRYVRLFGTAVEVLESEEGARRWLHNEQRGLGFHRPLEYADTEAGAREVENLLGRIDHGVLS